MGGGKETPRQKMIGMMYLVLTALLALNVSAEVLEAFGNITRGINETIKVTEVKNAEFYGMIQARVSSAGDDENAKLVGEKVGKVKEIKAGLDEYLAELTKQIVENDGDQTWDQYINGSDDNNPLQLVDPKNIDVASKLLVEKGAKPESGGEQLMKMINETRLEFVNLFDGLEGVTEETKANFDKALTLRAEDDPTEKGAKKDWEFKTFNSIPRGAAIALLTKYQNDLQNAEGEVLKGLLDAISTGKIEISDFVPVVKVAKSALAVGEKLDAEIFLAAQIGGVVPEITVGGKKIKVDPATGRGKYEVVTSAQGSMSTDVKISVVNTKTGKSKEYPTKLEYDVFKAPAIISADKMNVVYAGLENPMSISVPGFEPKNISASITPSGYAVLKSQGNGKYIVDVKRRHPKGINVNVSVKLPGGGSKTMGSQTFRTMKVPSPIASLNGNMGPTISTGAIGAVKQLSVSMGDFVFEGIRYKVSKFDYIWKPARGQLLKGNASGNALPNQLRGAMSSAKRGDMLIISAIYAKEKRLGEVPLPGSLVFTVK